MPPTSPHLKLPPSFVPHHRSMALRAEGLTMLAALVQRRHSTPSLFEQLVRALQRDRCLVREVARLTPLVTAGGGGGLARGSAPLRDEALYASVVTLLLLLDTAADLRVWQLMAEADAARTVHLLHLEHFPEAPGRQDDQARHREAHVQQLCFPAARFKVKLSHFC